MHDMLDEYPIEVRALVSYGSIISSLNNMRSNLRPSTPRSLGVLGACLLEPEYAHLTKCEGSQESLFAGICGTMPSGTLSLVFVSPAMKEFMQTRTLAIVMARAIMLRRTEEAYGVLFDYLKALMPNFNPTAIKCDFEDGQINAWRSKFPNATAVFAYPKNKLGLFHLIKTKPVVASIIRSAGALPLLPTQLIQIGLLALGNEALEKGWMPQLKLFFKYLEKEWIPKTSVLSVMNSAHRTNNIAETVNRSFNKFVKVANPSCFSVLRAFTRLNDKYTVDLQTLNDPIVALGRGRRISALRNDKYIKRLTIDLQNGDISTLAFLHKSSRRLQNVFDKVYTN
ncbi:Phosphatidylglycerol--prolipoprotein diacylglyceryl transferase [Frankliniella fusca]|uniref:Phosphatidylglycerol--prolipoprotein diacylglyceryl transferase n=1 Tax=Frankliniella fusca TaxID=407009 RepID=A0AAE1H4W7_9NEOP|nr:Phosphatidylglycerol--prolipoprotein diacylglyceryl transferase [Frankliniella fusca]